MSREPIGRHERMPFAHPRPAIHGGAVMDERSPFAPGPQDREAVKLMAAQRVQPYQGRHRP